MKVCKIIKKAYVKPAFLDILPKNKKNKKNLRKGLTNGFLFDIILTVAERLLTGLSEHGSIAQLGEHLPYKQRVIGSSPVVPTSAQAQRCKWPGSSVG